MRRITIEKSQLEHQIAMINNAPSPCSISIDEPFGDFGTDLEFLREMKNVHSVVLRIEKKVSLAPLYSLNGIRALTLLEDYPVIDMNEFIDLHWFSATWSNKIKNLKSLEKCRNLQQLTLRKYRSKSKDLSDFEGLTQLQELTLVGGNTQSLSGLASLSKLKKLKLAYMRSLTDISDVKKTKLTELEIEKCPKVMDVKPTSEMLNIERLSLEGVGNIDNLSFIQNMTTLKVLSIVGTNLIDGNFDLCKEHPSLEKMAFDDKRHYNIKWKDLYIIIERLRNS